MQIGTSISDLLYRHECVIIPGYGAFLSRRVPAQLYRQSHHIYPPKKSLSFNETLQQNDGLLVNHITAVEKCTYDEALLKVRSYVRYLNHQIDEDGSVTLHKIGRFMRSEGQLQFVPMYLVNYLPEAYGLTQVDSYEVQRMAESIKDPIPEEPILAVQTPETPVVPLKTQVVEKETSSPWLKYAAIGIIAIGIAGAVGYNSYTNYQNTTDLAIEELAQQELKNKIQEATFTIESPLPTIEIKAKQVVRNYHIIAGAFREPENADKKVAQLTAQGYKAALVGVNKYGLHNVAFESYASREDALNALSAIKAQGHSGAWLFVGQLPKI